MQEQWRPIKDYEGLYEVSNLGRVKSLPKYHNCGKKSYMQSEKILKLNKRRDGYLQVMLYKDKKEKTLRIHRLVAQAFIPNPENKPFINHIDCDPSNNCVTNLEWVTQKENIQYASKLGRIPNNFKNVSSEQRRINGKKCSKPVISINLVTGEETFFDSQHEAGRQLNLNRAHINDVLKGRQKRIGNYTFKYENDKQENTLF